MSQIKQADKTRKRNPLLPVLGLMIAVTVFIFAYAVEDPFVKLIAKRFPQAGLTQTADPFSATRILITFGIWLVLLTIFSIVVAILGGRQPDDARDLVLPPRTQKERDERYGAHDD